jgi:hypothetical protein
MQRVFEKLEPEYAALDARATILPDRDRCLPDLSVAAQG